VEIAVFGRNMPAFKGVSGISGSMTGQSVATATLPIPFSRALLQERPAAVGWRDFAVPGRTLSLLILVHVMGASADRTIDLRGAIPAAAGTGLAVGRGFLNLRMQGRARGLASGPPFKALACPEGRHYLPKLRVFMG